jgi:serine/threonine-protein kinase
MQNGRVIAGKYRLIEPIAAGGMGSVWRARHLDLEIDVAVKLIAAGHGDDELTRERFKREARAAAQLKSPFVVAVLDYGIEAAIPYMVMELLDGEDLRAHLDHREKLEPARVRGIIEPIGKALRAAHAAGLVHRDLKPANVFLSRSGAEEIVKVLDFGIAKELDPERGSLRTKTSVLLGSPLYMSPERVRGDAVDHRADLWSLAMMALEMLTGVHPFRGASVEQILQRVSTDPIPRPSELGVPSRGLDAFFARAFHPDPDARFASATDLTRAFADAVDQPAAAVPARGLARDGDTLDIATGSAPAQQRLKPSRPYRAWIGVGLAAIVVVPAVGYWWSAPSAVPVDASAPAAIASTSAVAEPIPLPATSAATKVEDVRATEPSSSPPASTPASSASAAPTARPAARTTQQRPAAAPPLPSTAPAEPAIDPTFGVPVRKK